MSDEELEVNRKILKELALCECLAQSWTDIGFDTLDYSRALLFENLSYPKSVFDSLDLIVGNVIKSSIGKYRIEDELYNINNYRCIRFYKSNYLDSIIRTFDHLLLNNLNLNRSENYFISDSIEYEVDFLNSQKEQKND